MRFGVYNLILPDRDFAQQCALARDTGWDGLEIRIRDVPPEKRAEPYSFWGNHKDWFGASNLEAAVPRIRAALTGSGLTLAGLAPYTPLLAPDEFELMARVAADLGAPVIRVMAPWYDGTRPYDELFAASVAGLERVEAIARARGVKAVLEIHHGSIAPSASAARRLLEGFDPEAVGVIFDPGNMVHEGFERWPMGLDLLGPYLAHVHVKNAAWILADRPAGQPYRWEPRDARLREGQADWGAILAALDAAGYDGWLTLEDFTNQPADEKLGDALAFLKALRPA